MCIALLIAASHAFLKTHNRQRSLTPRFELHLGWYLMPQ
jgi:hypothetical protein